MQDSWQINHWHNDTPAMLNKCQIYNCFPGSVTPMWRMSPSAGQFFAPLANLESLALPCLPVHGPTKTKIISGHGFIRQTMDRSFCIVFLRTGSLQNPRNDIHQRNIVLTEVLPPLLLCTLPVISISSVTNVKLFAAEISWPNDRPWTEQRGFCHPKQITSNSWSANNSLLSLRGNHNLPLTWPWSITQ